MIDGPRLVLAPRGILQRCEAFLRAAAPDFMEAGAEAQVDQLTELIDAEAGKAAGEAVELVATPHVIAGSMPVFVGQTWLDGQLPAHVPPHWLEDVGSITSVT